MILGLNSLASPGFLITQWEPGLDLLGAASPQAHRLGEWESRGGGGGVLLCQSILAARTRGRQSATLTCVLGEPGSGRGEELDGVKGA